MTFTAVQTIALIFILFVLIKLVIVLVNRKAWLNFSTKVYDKPMITSTILGILGILILFYLLQEISIVQIVAVLAFASILFGLGFLQYPKEILNLGKKILRGKHSPGIILYVIVWLALILWALFAIFS